MIEGVVVARVGDDGAEARATHRVAVGVREESKGLDTRTRLVVCAHVIVVEFLHQTLANGIHPSLALS